MSSTPNKLVVLDVARRRGLAVPSFRVLRRLEPCHKLKPGDFVAKALSDGIYLWDSEDRQRGYFSYTETLDELLAPEEYDEVLPTSFVQERLCKRFEVRSFYLDGAFASAAIISQRDAQTATDYRKYRTRKPNRNVPFDLPTDVADKLRLVFDDLGLNTGSADIVCDEDGRFVLLEINPYGLFGGIEESCNLAISKAIAGWLSGEIVDGWTFRT